MSELDDGSHLPLPRLKLPKDHHRIDGRAPYVQVYAPIDAPNVERYDVPNGRIAIRRVNEDLPQLGGHYYVEFRVEDGDAAPLGMAVVSVLPRPAYDGQEALLKQIFVIDSERRQGIGTTLIGACLNRWPHIDLGDGDTDDGEAFLNAIRKSAEAVQSDETEINGGDNRKAESLKRVPIQPTRKARIL